MIVTSKYIFVKPKVKEINNIIKNTQPEYEQKYGYNYCRKVNVKCNVNFVI